MSQGEEAPDVLELFEYYDDVYFQGNLRASGVTVEWSSRMVSNSGKAERNSTQGNVAIKLSQPLLDLRPLIDTQKTILHHMIHAFCLSNPTGPLETDDTSGGHGLPPTGGYKITLKHQNFREEAEILKNHRWKCQRCGNVISRTTNRKPQQADCPSGSTTAWGCTDYRCTWHRHMRKCGGDYMKIEEPADYAARKSGGNKKKKTGGSGAAVFTGHGEATGWDSTGWNTVPSQTQTLPSINAVMRGQQQENRRRSSLPSPEERRALQEAAALKRAIQGSEEQAESVPTPEKNHYPKKRQIEVITLVDSSDDDAPGPSNRAAAKSKKATTTPPPAAGPSVTCPFCRATFAEDDDDALNEHLGSCPGMYS